MSNPLHQYDFTRCPIIIGGWRYTDDKFTWLPGNRYMWDDSTITAVTVPYEFPLVSSAVYSDGESNGFVTWAAESDLLLNYKPRKFSKGEYTVIVEDISKNGVADKRDCAK